jgi:hypothetical protein
MACETMQELKDAESNARGLCRASKDDDHLQMLYGEWALEAKRMQRIHWDSCYDCQNNVVETSSTHKEGLCEKKKSRKC